ncbi:hypothetical protein ABIF38_006401 [Bradyrhizobium japonicum]|uniref:hypothetical protein n=1 Tax=Bradyrhizobium elkanii TaxID=29448 RepID=UPI000364AAC9|nr:hypothetical protein [Bradyrhizobium elkanii]WAX24332.1 hypothetical protein [Bradyrhizobium phage ppBeUSDA76-1]MCP1731291.1 hypothetical protein [Bradyrhizobium elkanii]MCS3575420.1 hypothetical protein [Bradyrhizobium elkanii]MCS3591889.1 hypothetical protein [Bradyrhizobium elkanii]MCS3621334.1 hypothetical protein [Bradyrhizobium elkanii]
MSDRVSLTRQISAVEAELRDVRSGARTKVSMRREGIEAALKTLRWLDQNAQRVGPMPQTHVGGVCVSLTRQISTVGAEINARGSSARAKLTASQAQYQCDGLEAAANTLRWLQQNEARIRGVMGQ